jgi:hypothetical protein
LPQRFDGYAEERGVIGRKIADQRIGRDTFHGDVFAAVQQNLAQADALHGIVYVVVDSRTVGEDVFLEASNARSREICDARNLQRRSQRSQEIRGDRENYYEDGRDADAWSRARE